MKINKEKMYSTKEVALLLNRNQQVVNRDCREWKYPSVKILWRWMVRWADLDLIINPKEPCSEK